MVAPVRFFAEDTVTGTIKTQNLGLNAWSYGDQLNGGMDLTGGIPLTDKDANEQILDPYRTAIYAVRGDSVVEWGGILKPPVLSQGASTIQLSCMSWIDYWKTRTIRKDYTPFQVDQFEIFEQLVQDAQDEGAFGDGFDLGITVTWDALSGVLRDRQDDYRPWKTKNLGDALSQLAAVVDGFDFSMSYALNTTTDRIDKSISLWYPRKGRDTDFLFEYERGRASNVISRGFAAGGTFAWVGDGWGAGNDSTRLMSSYIDDSLRGVYPPYDASPSWATVSDQGTLDEHTAAYFARTNRPRLIPVLRVNPDEHPRWGDYATGDVVNLRIIDDGYGSTGIVPRRDRITGWNTNSKNEFDLVFADPLGDAQAEMT